MIHDTCSMILRPMFQLLFETNTALTEQTGSSTNALWLVGVAFVLVLLVFVVFHRLLRALRRPDLHGLTRERVRTLWKEIEETADNGLIGAKLAVIEADKLLDNALKSLMMPGETMGERLKTAGYKYPQIGRVWGAHRLRNQLVHDTTFEISSRQAKEALHDFREALRLINVMD